MKWLHHLTTQPITLMHDLQSQHSHTGQYCTEDVDECELSPNACQNGGTCHNTVGGFHCVCVNGWTGDDCSENIDDCASAACYHGATCHDRVASFYCECPHGRTGKFVEFACEYLLRMQLQALCMVLFTHQFVYSLVYVQVCCVIWMMHASVTPVRKAPTVTPTLSMAWPSAPARLAIPALPATRTLTSALLVIA